MFKARHKTFLKTKRRTQKRRRIELVSQIHDHRIKICLLKNFSGYWDAESIKP